MDAGVAAKSASPAGFVADACPTISSHRIFPTTRTIGFGSLGAAAAGGGMPGTGGVIGSASTECTATSMKDAHATGRGVMSGGLIPGVVPPAVSAADHGRSIHVEELPSRLLVSRGVADSIRA
jgi:hypothetical protein